MGSGMSLEAFGICHSPFTASEETHHSLQIAKTCMSMRRGPFLAAAF